MATLQDIIQRAEALKEETALNSISPDRAGGIMYDTLIYINQMQLQGATPLLISKIYASVAAMEADSAPVSDLTGQPLRPGQVVVIATGDPDDPDEGVVYRYDGTEGGASSWTAVGKIGNLEPVDSLDSDSTTLPLAAHQGKVLDSKISQLGQYVDNPEWVKVVTDNNDKVLFGVKSDGNFYFGAGCPPQVKEKILDFASIKVDKEDGKSLINSVFASAQEVIDNPEYLSAETDSEGKLLEGRREDGVKVEKVAFETPKIDTNESNIGDIKTNTINSQEFLDVQTDENGKILSGRTKDGKLREFAGLVSPDVEAENISGQKAFVDELNLGDIGGKELNKSINPNIWTGKKIAWYGTSIPAGMGNIILPISGYGINARLSYAAEQHRYETGGRLPAEYPVITASLLGADSIFNMSVGSSRITRNLNGADLRIRCLSLMNSAKNNLDTIFGAYNIDLVNKTFSENLDNTVGITTYPDYSGASWTTFVRGMLGLIDQSYEIRLVARFLLPESDNSAYVHLILGDYYSAVETMLSDVGSTMDEFAGHLADVDLICLEHSVNDPISTVVPLDSESVDTYAGAYNKAIETIRFYKPETRIVIISNYMDLGQDNLGVNRTEYIQSMAARQHIPFCKMEDYSMVSWVNQITQGYWDASGYWHDSGFTWTEDEGNDSYTTNCTFPSAIRSSSLSQMRENVNPHQVNGVWCWESAVLYQWCADGVHPHSDKTGRLIMIIARVLHEFLKTIGN